MEDNKQQEQEKDINDILDLYILSQILEDDIPIKGFDT